MNFIIGDRSGINPFSDSLEDTGNIMKLAGETCAILKSKISLNFFVRVYSKDIVPTLYKLLTHKQCFGNF